MGTRGSPRGRVVQRGPDLVREWQRKSQGPGVGTKVRWLFPMEGERPRVPPGSCAVTCGSVLARGRGTGSIADSRS